MSTPSHVAALLEAADRAVLLGQYTDPSWNQRKARVEQVVPIASEIAGKDVATLWAQDAGFFFDIYYAEPDNHRQSLSLQFSLTADLVCVFVNSDHWPQSTEQQLMDALKALDFVPIRYADATGPYTGNAIGRSGELIRNLDDPPSWYKFFFDWD